MDSAATRRWVSSRFMARRRRESRRDPANQDRVHSSKKCLGDYRVNKRISVFHKALVPALLFCGVLAAQAAEQQAAATRWSDPATWPNRKVPVAGDKVTIGRDKNVVLDVSPPVLGGLSIDGKLSFSNDADLELTTEWIMVHGELAIG